MAAATAPAPEARMDRSSVATVNNKHAFGLKGDVSRNIAYLLDGRLAYPVGNNVVLYQPPMENSESSNTQTFLQRPYNEVGEGITAMSITSRFMAIAERGERPVVRIYDANRAARAKRTLLGYEQESKEFVSVCLDHNSKYLLTLGGAPDYVLGIWPADKTAVLATVKVATGKGETATMCSFHNVRDTVCVTGNKVCKLFRYRKETEAFEVAGPKRSATQKPEEQNFTCHCWVTDELLLCGTDNGKIAVINGLDFDASSVPYDPAHNGEFVAITCIVPIGRGFIIGTMDGRVIIYERRDDKDGTDDGMHYAAIRNLHVPSSDPQNPNGIQHLALGGASPEADLVATTRLNQIYILRDLSSFLVKDSTSAGFEALSQAFHSAPITGMDCCIRKSLIVTCSTDRSVRIWNFLERTLELNVYNPEEAFSVAMHPAGHQILVGFSDRLRLMNVLVDGLQNVKEFATLRACREVRFSNGGQYFAAMRDQIIQVYNTYTFDMVMPLKGHNGKVRSIFWTPDDLKLISCGVDGAVYEWDLSHGGKKNDLQVDKACAYTSAVRTKDGRAVYAVGSDRKLKEISSDPNEHEPRAIDTGGAVYTQVALSRENRMLLVGTDKGAVRAIQYPIPSVPQYLEYVMHSSAVTRLRISYDDQWLFSVGDDGTLFICQLRDGSGSTGSSSQQEEVAYSEEVLVTRAVLKQKDEAFNSLTAEITNERAMWAFKQQNQLQEARREEDELKMRHQQLHEEMRSETYHLRMEKEHLQSTYEQEIERLKEQHRRALEKLTQANEEQTIQLQKSLEKMETAQQMKLDDWKVEREKLRKQYSEAESDINARHQEEVVHLQEQIEEKLRVIENDRKEYEETKRQIEEDADEEIQGRIHHWTEMIDTRDEAMLKLKGQVGIMRKEFKQLKKASTDKDDLVASKENEIATLRATLNTNKNQITDLRKEIQEREETIQDKEDRIHELKKKNQELEKFKFVLEFKNKELNQRLEPKDEQINDQLKQINDMDAELEKYFKTNMTYKLTVENLELKVKALEKELLVQRARLTDAQAITKRFRTDLHETVQHIQDAKALKELVKELYQKHVTMQVQDAGVDVDIQGENRRQREYLERSVSSLKRKLNKDSQLHRADNGRIMQENVSLIKEINELRREIKTLKASNRNRESMERTKGMSTHTPSQRARSASSSRDVDVDTAAMTPEVQALFDQKKQQIRGLLERIAQLEGQVAAEAGFEPRLNSSGRLPSIGDLRASGPDGVVSSSSGRHTSSRERVAVAPQPPRSAGNPPPARGGGAGAAAAPPANASASAPRGSSRGNSRGAAGVLPPLSRGEEKGKGPLEESGSGDMNSSGDYASGDV